MPVSVPTATTEHRRYRAAWVLPMSSPPLREGWVDVRGGVVTAVGGARASAVEHPAPSAPDRVVDLGDVAIVPAHVNAHTHLELSALRGRVPPVTVMTDWVRQLMRERPTVSPADTAGAIDAAVHELQAWGIAGVGDVTNSLAPIAHLQQSALAWVAFHEVLGFRVEDGDAAVRQAVAQWPTTSSSPGVIGLAAHAPYSTSPALIAAVGDWVAADHARRTTIHVGESPEEVTFLRSGDGPWRTLLESLGAWSPGWRAPGTTPAAYVESLGLLGPRTLVVHGTQFDREDVARVARSGATLVLCPRSNRWTGAGVPPVAVAHECGGAVALGTDSLASVDDLGLFGELAAARAIAPGVPARWLLRAASEGGAQALGFGHLGTIEPGRSGRLVAIAVPPREGDVEEYLLSGIGRSAIRWIDE